MYVSYIYVGTTPKRTRGGLTRHSSVGHVAYPTLCPDDHMDWHVAHPSSVWMSSPDPVANVSNKILDRISWAIITHFAKSILDRTFLGLYRRPATTCPAPPVEWKDKGDGKSSPQQSLSAACRIMMALPLSEYHHNRKSQRVFSPFKGTKLLAL